MTGAGLLLPAPGIVHPGAATRPPVARALAARTMAKVVQNRIATIIRPIQLTICIIPELNASLSARWLTTTIDPPTADPLSRSCVRMDSGHHEPGSSHSAETCPASGRK
ncbi:MAG: hypothetical protein ACWGOX_14965 [Desulforhopalus sp.]